MNCQQAKNIDIVEFLGLHGFNPIKEKGNDLYYLSPVRDKEKTPSFHVSKSKNKWFDFGTGQGGNIIDLSFELYKTKDLKTVLNKLENLNVSNFSFSQQQRSVETKEPQIKTQKIQELRNRALIEYFRQRKISLATAKKYCKEIYYSTSGKSYFAIGFKNDSGSYELRNKYFKGATGKNITTIKGETSKLNIFEGFFDFLSALQFLGVDGLRYKTIVLNSLSNLDKIKETLFSFNEVNLFLDNDSAGEKKKEFLKNLGLTINDKSSIYKGYKDFNNFLTNKYF
jgi:hypothetical protein